MLCLLCLAVLASLFACGPKKHVYSDDAVVFVDALGREVSVTGEPERVAALLGSFADVWQLAGGELCAAANDAWEDFGLELGDAVDIGGAHSPSLELLVSSEPELVLASASTASNVQMREALEQMGICVIYFDVDCFEDYLYMLDICTDITGRKDLYEQNGLDIKAAIDAIKEEFASLELDDEKKSVLLLRASAGRVKAKGSEGTILGEMLCDMGCINIADGNDAILENLSLESIIEKNPHHVFVVTMGNDTEAARAALTQMMEENGAWGELEAISEGRLHVMDRRLFNIKPNARWAEAYEKLYEALVSQK